MRCARRGSASNRRSAIVLSIFLIGSLFTSAMAVSAGSDSTRVAQQPNPDPIHYLSCDLTTQAPLSSACEHGRDVALSAAQHARQASPNTTNCYDGNLAGFKVGDTQQLSAQLDWYTHGSGYYCFYFFSTPNNNDPDFDDYWFAQIRMWVCGTLVEFAQNSGIGPPAWTQTSTRYYSGCGPQADDAGSYAVVGGQQYYFAYLHF